MCCAICDGSSHKVTLWSAREEFKGHYSLVAMLYQFPSSLTFLDSLATCPSPFVKVYAMPELYILRANFNVMMGNVEKSVALIDSFCLQPLPKEIPRLL